jgi:hypothetical protein
LPVLSLLGAVGDFLKVLLTALGWLKEEREKQIGVDIQQGADAKAALALETKVAQIAAQPVTQSAVDQALSKGGLF